MNFAKKIIIMKLREVFPFLWADPLRIEMKLFEDKVNLMKCFVQSNR